MKNIKNITPIAIGFTLAFATLVAAEPKPERMKVDVEIPVTATALWTEIDVQRKALAEAVSAKDKDGVYKLAETVEALAAAIPDKYPDLAGDKKKRVQGQAKNVGRVLDELHDAMDEGKVEEAQKKLSQIETALKIIKAQLPS